MEHAGRAARGGARARHGRQRSCCLAEIGAEDAGGAQGFVFFRHQGTRSAAEGHGLSRHDGGFDGSAESTTAVGHEVTAALTAAGPSAVWDGDPAKAIEPPSPTWHQRLVGRDGRDRDPAGEASKQ
ncbi:DUF6891 domain-containing protein [Streptomyces sp. NPDC101237]|uniref:DUF6891 domain-containing protein n=1 Tax=Streptomyces sp. NPDC101237 TaxID=3366139 RepID=UPI00380C51C7